MTAERLTIPPMPEPPSMKDRFGGPLADAVAMHRMAQYIADLQTHAEQGWEAAQAQARRADEAEADAKLWHVEVGQALGFVTTWQGRKEVVAEANRLRAEVEALKARLADAREKLASKVDQSYTGNSEQDERSRRAALGGEEKSDETQAGSECSARLGVTFERFLESRGFHADACQATVDPDLYEMAKCLWKTLVRIGDQGFESIHRGPQLPTAYLKAQAARDAST